MKPNTIWKFQLELADRQTVEMPMGHLVFHVFERFLAKEAA